MDSKKIHLSFLPPEPGSKIISNDNTRTGFFRLIAFLIITITSCLIYFGILRLSINNKNLIDTGRGLKVGKYFYLISYDKTPNSYFGVVKNELNKKNFLEFNNKTYANIKIGDYINPIRIEANIKFKEQDELSKSHFKIYLDKLLIEGKSFTKDPYSISIDITLKNFKSKRIIIPIPKPIFLMQTSNDFYKLKLPLNSNRQIFHLLNKGKNKTHNNLNFKFTKTSELEAKNFKKQILENKLKSTIDLKKHFDIEEYNPEKLLGVHPK